MLVDNNIVFSFLTCCVVFKYSKQQKPGECKPCDNGQYWSRSLISMCMACPKILKVCGDQGVDEQCCFDSCRKPEKTSTTAKMTSTTAEKTSTTAEMTSTATEMASTTAGMTSTTAGMTSSTAEMTSTTAEMTSTTAEMTSTTAEISSSTAEMTSTTAEMTSSTAEMTSSTAEMTSSTAEMTSSTAEMTSSTAEMTSSTAEMTSTPEIALSTKGVFTSAVEKPPAHVNYFNWQLLATVIVLCVLVSVALLLLLKQYLYVRQNFPRNPQGQAGKTGEEELIALQNLAIQVTDRDSSTRFGGIQDTEVSNGTSASVLNMPEIHN